MRRDCPYKFLETELWYILLGRAAIFRAVKGRLGDLADAAKHWTRYGDTVRDALNRLYQIVNEVARSALNGQQVVSEVSRAWLHELRRIVDQKGVEPDARRLLAELHSLVEQAVASDPFREIFERVQAQASPIYKPHWRETSLSLGHVREHPRRASRDPYALTAVTTTAGRHAVIQLNIYPPDFGPAAYAALPSIFIHECICHVPAKQDKDDNRSVFSEGFMDWAAVQLFENQMGRMDTQLMPAAKQHGKHLAELLKDEANNPAWAERTYGHRQADILADWFLEQIPLCSGEEARVKVIRLAVELNRTDSLLEMKNRFVVELTSTPSIKLARRLMAWATGGAPVFDLLDF